MDVRRGEVFGIGCLGGVILMVYWVVCFFMWSGIIDLCCFCCGGELVRGGWRVVDLKFVCSVVFCGWVFGGIL